MVESWPARLVGEKNSRNGRVRGADGRQRWIWALIFVPRAAHTGKADPTPLRISNSLIRRLRGMR